MSRKELQRCRKCSTADADSVCRCLRRDGRLRLPKDVLEHCAAAPGLVWVYVWLVLSPFCSCFDSLALLAEPSTREARITLKFTNLHHSFLQEALLRSEEYRPIEKNQEDRLSTQFRG